jgi:hypothetical protein
MTHRRGWLGLVCCVLLWHLPAAAALVFDGTDDRIATADAVGAPTGYPMSFAFWGKVTATDTKRTIVQTGTYINASSGSGVSFAIEANETVLLYTAGTNIGFDSTGTIPNGAWIFIGTSSASATSHRFFCYNFETRSVVFNETSTTNLGAIVAPTTRINLGHFNANGAFSDFFNGTMTAVALYAADLTGNGGNAFQAMAFLGPYAVGTPSLLYTFNEMAGTSVWDQRGVGGIGTMTNFPGAPWVPMSLPAPRIP